MEDSTSRSSTFHYSGPRALHHINYFARFSRLTKYSQPRIGKR